MPRSTYRSSPFLPPYKMLRKENVRPASKGEPTLLVLTVPAVASSVGDEVDVYALPLEFRQGGLLLALPHDSLSAQTLSDGQTGSDEHPFGPNSIFSAELLEEADDVPTPVAVPLGIEAQVLVVDVPDDILSKCREYDPVTDSLPCNDPWFFK